MKLIKCFTEISLPPDFALISICLDLSTSICFSVYLSFYLLSSLTPRVLDVMLLMSGYAFKWTNAHMSFSKEWYSIYNEGFVENSRFINNCFSRCWSADSLSFYFHISYKNFGKLLFYNGFTDFFWTNEHYRRWSQTAVVTWVLYRSTFLTNTILIDDVKTDALTLQCKHSSTFLRAKWESSHGLFNQHL